MSKFRLLVFSVLVFGLAFVGCDKATNIGKPKSIRIALPSWYGPKMVPAVTTAIDQWNQSHPNTKAEVNVLVGKRDAILQKIMLGAKRRDFADAVLVRNEWIGTLMSNDLIAPFAADVAARIKEGALPGLLSAIAEGDQVWAIPFDADVFVTWVRRDMLSRKSPGGLNWNATAFKMLAYEISDRIESPDKKYGFAFPAANAQPTALVFLNWYIAYKGRFKKSGQNIQLDPKAMERALDFLQVIVNQKSAPSNVIALQQNDIFSGLAGGAYFMTAGGSWERGMLSKQSRLSDQIVSYPIPQYMDPPGPCLLGGWSFVQLAKSPKDTPALLEGFFAKEIQLQKLHENSLLPAARACLDDSWFSTNRDGGVFKGALDQGIALPLSSEASALLDRIALAVANVFMGKQSVKEAVENAQ